jgi:hypothetical protein
MSESGHQTETIGRLPHLLTHVATQLPGLLAGADTFEDMAAPQFDHQVIQDAVRGRREVPLVAGEVLVVCGSLLMIAGAALPRLGRSTGERMRSSEAERTLERPPVARSREERSGVGGR